MSHDAAHELPERLRERFLREILAFPGRLEAMETRDEESCRRLAARLAEVAAAELAPPDDRGRAR